MTTFLTSPFSTCVRKEVGCMPISSTRRGARRPLPSTSSQGPQYWVLSCLVEHGSPKATIRSSPTIRSYWWHQQGSAERRVRSTSDWASFVKSRVRISLQTKSLPRHSRLSLVTLTLQIPAKAYSRSELPKESSTLLSLLSSLASKSTTKALSPFLQRFLIIPISGKSVPKARARSSSKMSASRFLEHPRRIGSRVRYLRMPSVEGS